MEEETYYSPAKLVLEFSGKQMFEDGRAIIGVCLFILILKLIARSEKKYNKVLLSIFAFITPAVLFLFTPEFNINSILIYGFAGYIIVNSYRTKDEEAEKKKQSMLKYYEGKEKEAFEKGYDYASKFYQKPMN